MDFLTFNIQILQHIILNEDKICIAKALFVRKIGMLASTADTCSKFTA